MSADWEVGDLALCVSTRDIEVGAFIGIAGRRLRKGAIYTVTGLKINGAARLALFLAEDSSGLASGAWRFRKVTPPKADAFDLETINLMNPKPVEAVR